MKVWRKLIDIARRLRGPDGCPWDQKQTHESLKPYIIEEAHEVIQAIDEKDDAKLCEELGDLLWQIVFHAQLASERDAFDIESVVSAISEKLTVRHPHVFEDKAELTTEEVLHNWEQIKVKNSRDSSILKGVPRSLPALLKAYRVQEKVGRYGFDWKETMDVIDKLKEELAEFEQALKEGKKAEQHHELGDLLFSLVNLGRHLELQAEETLNASTDRFIRRFQYVEKSLDEKGKTLADSDLEEMDTLWEEAKSKLM